MRINTCQRANQFTGFTLLELMITIAILGILSAIAYPGFESSIQDRRLTSQSNRILAALHYARSEASANHIEVKVCGSSDQQNCDSPNWSKGFIIKENTEDKKVLQAFKSLEGNNHVEGGDAITFNGEGVINTVIQLSLCDQRGTQSAKGIRINGAGQARIGGDPQCS